MRSGSQVSDRLRCLRGSPRTHRPRPSGAVERVETWAHRAGAAGVREGAGEAGACPARVAGTALVVEACRNVIPKSVKCRINHPNQSTKKLTTPL